MRKMAVHKDFVREFGRLEKSVKDRVLDSLAKFETDERSGTHLEKINDAHPRLRSFRVTQSVRGIVLAPERGRRYLLLKVLPHDDAYQWARRSRFDVTRAGKLDIWNKSVLERVAATADPRSSGVAQQSNLFDNAGDEQLAAIGIDAELLPFVRTLRDTRDLDDAQGYLPSDVWDVLSALATGAISELPTPAAPADLVLDIPLDDQLLDAAIEASADQVHLVKDRDDLEWLLEYPFDLWRVYLHPSQQEIVDTDFTGPARVTGGPGTGKTVVAIHRAARFATAGRGRVLLTTYTRALWAAMERALDLLRLDDEVRRRIEIQTADAFAGSVVRELSSSRPGERRVLTDQPKNFWRRIIRDDSLDLGEDFLHEEYVRVVLAQQIRSEDDYLVARREGRGRRLGPQQRRTIWSAVERFEAELTKANKSTFETRLRDAAELLAGLPADHKPFAHIVIDEAQDLSPDHWRLLRAAVAEGPNDLFITGDGAQQIYHHRVRLSQLAVRVTGRSRHLSLNHRTSAEILRFTLDLLGDEEVDDLDAGVQPRDNISSSFCGHGPMVKGLATSQDELDYVGETVKTWIECGFQPSEIGVAVREHKQAAGFASAIRKRRIGVQELESGGSTGVAVGTMHSMKGLEFRCVAVTGVSADRLPRPGSITPESVDATTHQLDLQRERQLLFVACTRAREELIVTWFGEPSPLLRRVIGDGAA